MGQNISHAVMARRHESATSLDLFITPPWATRALVEHVIVPHVFDGDRATVGMFDVWEPACGLGHMVRALGEYFDDVYATDIVDHGCKEIDTEMDFMAVVAGPPIDWIITNPPFRLGAKFIQQALKFARLGVCMLVRAQFLETGGRYREIFRDTPPTIIAYFVERVPMHKGRLLKKGKTATAYVWLVWIKEWKPMAPVWIPPCRKQLEMDADYEEKQK